MAPDRHSSLCLHCDGAHYRHHAARDGLPMLLQSIAGLQSERAGLRITANSTLAALSAANGPIGSLAASVLGPDCRPVRTLLFDKTASTNWTIGWHQDRTILVAERQDVPGFGPWTVKQGLQHVSPPFALLATMITLRIHLDPVLASNAPLRIAPGSHRAGLIPIDEVDAMVQRCGERLCIAEAGDVWIYATPILHASDRATIPARRRVIQIDYAAFDLPQPLAWLGVG